MLVLVLCGLLALLQFPAKPEDRAKIVVGEEFDERPMNERPMNERLDAMPKYLPVKTETASK